jgi:acyl-CoA dehydrogenase
MMINFDMNPVEASLVDEVARQAKVWRRYARKLDTPQDHNLSSKDLFEIPEEKSFPHVRNMLRERVAETSGFGIIEFLIYMQESAGGKPIYFNAARDGNDMGLTIRLLKQISTSEQFEQWGHWILSWGMTEPGAGSDPAGMRGTAVLDEETDEWILNGEKTFISTIQEAQGALVMLKIGGKGSNEGIGVFMVEKSRPGFLLGPQFSKLGIRSRDLASFSLDNCRIPRSNRLEGSLRNALAAFNGTRILIAAEALGAIQVALDITRGSLMEGGTPIDYTASLDEMPAAIDRFIELEAEFEAAFLTALHSSWLAHRDGADKMRSAIAKVTAAGAARRIIRDCMNILGPNGTSLDYYVEKAMRDSRITDIYEGPGDVLRILIARTLLNYSSKELN